MAIVDLLDSYIYNVIMIVCILLAAGESRRFGSPKALAVINDKPAIGITQQILLDSGVVDEIIVVLGAHMELIQPYVFNHKKVRLVYNKNYKLGQTSSFQAGVSAVLDETGGIMLLPVDCPFVAGTTLEYLIRAFNEQSPSLLIPTFNGRRGHPPIFNASLKHEILALPIEQGINALFNRHTSMTIEVDDPGILKTFNTPEEFNQLGI